MPEKSPPGSMTQQGGGGGGGDYPTPNCFTSQQIGIFNDTALSSQGIENAIYIKVVWLKGPSFNNVQEMKRVFLYTGYKPFSDFSINGPFQYSWPTFKFSK